MAVEDFMEPEVAVAVAVTAAMSSPRVRRVVRQGAVYGLAGVLKAGDALGVFAQGVGRGVQQAAEEIGDVAEDEAHAAERQRPSRPAARASRPRRHAPPAAEQ